MRALACSLVMICSACDAANDQPEFTLEIVVNVLADDITLSTSDGVVTDAPDLGDSYSRVTVLYADYQEARASTVVLDSRRNSASLDSLELMTDDCSRICTDNCESLGALTFQSLERHVLDTGEFTDPLSCWVCRGASGGEVQMCY